MARGNLPLARFTDPRGRAHLVVLRGRFVLDVATEGPPRVVAELSAEEGPDQARALLAGDGGYLDRARLAEEPLCRPLRPEDLRPRAAAEDERVPQGHEPPTLAA